jgi:glycosyltransferase involved in cell wall biosynthesis
MRSLSAEMQTLRISRSSYRTSHRKGAFARSALPRQALAIAGARRRPMAPNSLGYLANAPFDTRKSMQKVPQPLVSAAICTRNRPDKIARAVESVLANTFPSFDLMVIDQSASDETERIVRRIAERDARVRYERMSKSGASRARNLAIATATGQYIACTDDDCIVPADWIENIVKAFEEQRDGELLYGQVLPAHPDGDGEALTPMLRIHKPERLDRVNGFRIFGMTANFAARRSVFERTGMFDEVLGAGGRLKSGEDFDLAYRAYRRNAVILLRPEVTVRHDGRREREEWPALLRGYGFGDGAFYLKHARCRDPYAAWLGAKVFLLTSAKFIVKTALGRRPTEIHYLSGFVQGVLGGLKFSVDRATLLYTDEN